MKSSDEKQSMTPEEILEEMKLMTELLRDPHPGFFTWSVAFRAEAKKLSKLFGKFAGETVPILLMAALVLTGCERAKPKPVEEAPYQFAIGDVVRHATELEPLGIVISRDRDWKHGEKHCVYTIRRKLHQAEGDWFNGRSEFRVFQLTEVELRRFEQ